MKYFYFLLSLLLWQESFSQEITELYFDNFPLVQVAGQTQKTAFMVKIQSDAEVESIFVTSIDFCIIENKTTQMLDDGQNFDLTAGDGIYTSSEQYCHVNPTTIPSTYTLAKYRFAVYDLTFVGGDERKYHHGLPTFLVNPDFLNTLVSETEVYNFDDNISYSQNLINYTSNKEFDADRIDYNLQNINTVIKTLWNDFNDPLFINFSPQDGNSHRINGHYIGNGNPEFLNYIGMYGLEMNTLTHEINHHYINYNYNFDLSSNSGHWGFIQDSRSGFGLGSYDGVFDSLYVQGGTVRYELEKPESNLHDLSFNNIELYLMGLQSLNEITFPIKYVKNAGQVIKENSTTGRFMSGSLGELSEQDILFYVNNNPPRQSVANELDLKLVVCTMNKLSIEEHAVLGHHMRKYEEQFLKETSNLGIVNTEINFIGGVSGLEMAHQAINLRIFPNPAENRIWINNPHKYRRAKFSIYHINGTKFKEGHLTNSELDISEIPSGIYFLVIIEDGNNITRKFIKY